MKTWEAMKALEDGFKVKKPSWNKGSYIVLNEKGAIVNEIGLPYSIISYTIVPNERWELYDDRKEVKEEKLKELFELVKELNGHWTELDEFVLAKGQKGYLNELYFQLLSMNEEYKLDE